MNSETGEMSLLGVIYSLKNRGYSIMTKGFKIVLTRNGKSETYDGFTQLYANKFLN